MAQGYDENEYEDEVDDRYFNGEDEDLTSTPAQLVRYGFIVVGILVLVLDIRPFNHGSVHSVIRFFIFLGLLFAAFVDKLFLPKSRVYDF